MWMIILYGREWPNVGSDVSREFCLGSHPRGWPFNKLAPLIFLIIYLTYLYATVNVVLPSRHPQALEAIPPALFDYVAPVFPTRQSFLSGMLGFAVPLFNRMCTNRVSIADAKSTIDPCVVASIVAIVLPKSGKSIPASGAVRVFTNIPHLKTVG